MIAGLILGLGFLAFLLSRSKGAKMLALIAADGVLMGVSILVSSGAFFIIVAIIIKIYMIRR